MRNDVTDRQTVSACCGRLPYSVSGIHGWTRARCSGCYRDFRPAEARFAPPVSDGENGEDRR